MAIAELASPQEAVVVTQPVAKTEGIGRLVALDVLRGTVMALMPDQYLQLPEAARAFPHHAMWSFIALHTERVPRPGLDLFLHAV